MANTVLGETKVYFYSGTPPTSSTIHGFKIRTDLTCKKIEPGKTLVSWDFVTTYNYNKNYPATSTQARATIKLSFTSADGSTFSEKINGSYDSGSGNYVTFRSGTEGAHKKLKSGSILVTHNQEGKATFKISANAAIGGYDCDKTVTYDLPDNMPYTACSMPTSITLPGTGTGVKIIKPNDSFTVSWSGAQGGTGNPISGYEVFYKISQDGTPPTESDYTGKANVDSSKNSHTFTSSNKKRGHSIVFGVKTLGTFIADDFNSDSELKTGGLIKINQLPDKPTVKAPSDLTVPSNGGNLTFSFAYNSDKDGQATKLEYKRGESSWTTLNSAVTSSTLFFDKNNKTISFRTFDGLESSEVVGFNIVINTPPSCTIAMSGESLKSVNNSSEYNYVIAPTCTLSNYGNAKMFTYILEINDKDQVELVKDVSSTSYNTPDIRTAMKGYFEDKGAKYRINVICKDKYEQKLVESKEYYYITKVPELKQLFNKHNEYDNVANFCDQAGWPTHYSRSLGYYFDYDTGYNIAQISNGGEYTKTNLEVSSEDNGKLLKGQKIFNAVSTPTNQIISFKLEKSNTGFVTDVVIQKNIKQVGTIRFFNLKFDTGTNIDYYGGISVIYCGGIPECFFAAFNAELCKDYGVFLEGSADLKESSRIRLRTKVREISLTREMGLQYKDTTDATTFFTTFNELEYYYGGIANKERDYDIESYLIFTNDFADTTEQKVDSTIKGSLIFVKAPKFSESLSFKLGSADFANVPFLHEGQKFTISTSITFYNTTNQKVIIQSRTDEKEWKDVAIFSTNCKPKQAWTGGEFEIPANTQEDEEVYFRLVAQSLTNQVTKEYNAISKKYKRFTYPNISILSNSYQPGETTESHGELTLDFKFNDLGYTPEQEDTYQFNLESLFYKTPETDKNNLNGVFDLNTDSQNTKIAFNFDEQKETDKMALGAKITMTCRNNKGEILSSITKENEADHLVYSFIYNLTPTVAYRKNYLGINVFEPGDKDIITIAESKGRNQIQYIGSSNTYCNVVGFILDGGTWGSKMKFDFSQNL